MNREDERIWTKDFISISLVQFIVFTIFYTLLTTLPLYVVIHLGKTEAQGGLVGTAMLLSAIIVRPLAGSLLEQLGYKKVLIASVILFTATTFGYIWTDQFAALIALRFIHGLSFGILTTATPVIAAQTIPAKKQGEGLGYFTMAMNLAVVAGPFIGLSAIQFVSFQTLFMILSALMVSGIIFSIGLKISGEEGNGTVRQHRRKGFSLQQFVEMKAVPVALMSGLVSFAYAGILSFISVYAEANDLGHVSSYFFLVFAVSMLLSRPYLGRLFDTQGPKIVIIPCLVIFAAGLVILSAAHSAIVFLLAAALIGIGYGTILPCTLSLAVQSSSKDRNSQSTATFFMLFDSGIAAGSFILGIIVSYVGYSLMFTFSAGLVILTAIGFHFLLNYTFAKRREQKMTAEGEKSV